MVNDNGGWWTVEMTMTATTDRGNDDIDDGWQALSIVYFRPSFLFSLCVRFYVDEERNRPNLLWLFWRRRGNIPSPTSYTQMSRNPKPFSDMDNTTLVKGAWISKCLYHMSKKVNVFNNCVLLSPTCVRYTSGKSKTIIYCFHFTRRFSVIRRKSGRIK